MATPTSPSVNYTGRFTGLVLGMVVFVCLVMIGFAGYLKFELDNAQAILAAPEAATSDQEAFDKLRRSLGYSGFIGIAQNFVVSHDPVLLQDMKTQIKAADDIITRMPEKLPTETRRDLQAIVSTFDAAMLQAEKSTSSPSLFTSVDMAPLYAALPVLDSRITSAAAVNRLAAQSQLQFWAMLLTLVCWGSLIIAAAMSVGIYLSLRDRNSAPLRALVQSIKNMAHGDLRTSIWGMERSDMVGELARTVDLARYHFSQLPDMSLLSDQGPVRIRFEGNTKSMFEAMIHLITRDSEQVRQQATTLADAVTQQQQAIAQISAQVQTVLHNILQRGQTGDIQVKQIVQDMVGSATALKHAQEHAADQLNRIVPFLQERAQGMSEITHITGKQVSQVLQSLILTERGLKTVAEQSEESIKKFSGTADDLSGRLFGAVNLLQASGKVLAETTESTQSRLNEAIEKLHNTIIQPPTVSAPVVDTDGIAATVAAETSHRLESLLASIGDSQQKMETIIAEQAEVNKVRLDQMAVPAALPASTYSAPIADPSDAITMVSNEAAMRLEGLIASIELTHTKIQDFVGAQSAAPQNPLQEQIKDISRQITELSLKLSMLQLQPGSKSGDTVEHAPEGDLLLEIKSGFETTNRNLSQVREQLTNMIINNSQIQPVSIAAALPQDMQEQMEQQTLVLTELVATLGVLDEHMQQLKADMHAIKG